ncbi:MAG TPA: lipid-binding SYLF domain-containing protein [Mariprofundaceae bacterium]|nr:lipid-binding SYLF domain-containing protein [Mariprofundaceae bacterium]
MRRLTWGMGALVTAMGLLLAPLAHAAGVDRAKAADKVNVAAQVLKEIMDTPDKGIPSDLLRQAAAVAIFPDVIKAGFVIGGKYGRGVIIKHDPGANRWSAPAFYSIGAGSLGWQIGAESTDLVLVIRHQRGVDSLLKNEFTLGGDASVAAGPVGRTAEASTDVALKSEVLAYSRSRGLFAGISLEGAKINPLDDYNQAYYGRKLTSRQILMEHKVSAPASARKLIEELERYSKPAAKKK